jgi:hypothetical protein
VAQLHFPGKMLDIDESLVHFWQSPRIQYSGTQIVMAPPNIKKKRLDCVPCLDDGGQSPADRTLETPCSGICSLCEC